MVPVMIKMPFGLEGDAVDKYNGEVYMLLRLFRASIPHLKCFFFHGVKEYFLIVKKIQVSPCEAMAMD